MANTIITISRTYGSGGRKILSAETAPTAAASRQRKGLSGACVRAAVVRSSA